MSWGSAPPFSLGVEEELFLVDDETLETAAVFEQIVPEPDERLKPELFACFVETTTPVCRDADEVLAELQRLRAEVVGRAARLVPLPRLGPLRDFDAGHHLCPDQRAGRTTWREWLAAQPLRPRRGRPARRARPG